MRGYFGIGIDGVSKLGNLGNLVRTAYAFGASFTFAIAPKIVAHTGEPITRNFADTAKSTRQIPFYEFSGPEEFDVPRGCQIVAVELSEDAIELPVFRHPTQAVYILGGERASVSDTILERAHHVIKIPTKFSLNVATAGAIVLYDRLRVLGGYPDRPLMPGARAEEKPRHVHGKSFSRSERRAAAAAKSKNEET